MANAHKGEVEFKAGDKTYKLSYSADALCELEGALSRSAGEIIAIFMKPDEVRLSDIRIIFWKGLEDHQPGITFEDARAILKKLQPSEMGSLVGDAFALAMPQGMEGEVPADPPKPGGPAVGTGPAS